MAGQKRTLNRASGRTTRERGAFAALEGEAFRSKLAKHDMQRGYDDKGDGDGNGVRADLREGHKTVGKKRLNEVGEGRLADPAEGERRDGDAELGGCEVGVKMVDGSLERPGATLSLCHELCHPAAPDGDQGELGGDKEAICRHE